MNFGHTSTGRGSEGRNDKIARLGLLGRTRKRRRCSRHRTNLVKGTRRGGGAGSLGKTKKSEVSSDSHRLSLPRGSNGKGPIWKAAKPRVNPLMKSSYEREGRPEINEPMARVSVGDKRRG